MYRYFPLLILLLVSCSNQRQPEQKNEVPADSGIEVQSPSGHFTIALPPDFPTPEADTQFITTASDDTISMYTYISEINRGICIFGSNEYSSTTFAQQTPDNMLDNALNGALRQWSARLSESKPFIKNGGKGVSFWFVSKMDGKDLYGRFDYLLSKPRMYQVGFLSHDKSEILKPDIQKYFGSLAVPVRQ